MRKSESERESAREWESERAKEREKREKKRAIPSLRKRKKCKTYEWLREKACEREECACEWDREKEKKS